jgi:uncharacterized protein with von Willebrand factor type A (vWA) domain
MLLRYRASFTGLHCVLLPHIALKMTKIPPPNLPSAGGNSSFPTDPAEFDADERISFSKLDNKFLLVVSDGTEYEFDDAIKRWIPVVDEALLEEQQKAYQVAGVDESEPVDALKRKRKKEYVNGDDVIPNPHPINQVPKLTASCRKVGAKRKQLRSRNLHSRRKRIRQSM